MDSPQAVPPRLDIGGIANPRSVAVFGASDNKDKFGGRVMHYLTRHGFAGRVLPINPNRAEVLGFPAFRSIADAPKPIDVAILAVPAASLVQSVGECAAAGVGCCVVMTTGFAEAGTDEGRDQQRRIVETARAAGMRIVGPNCMGMISPLANMALTSSLVLEIDRIRTGSVGLVSQSGALMVSIFNRAHDAGIGFSLCVSLGNQSDLEICDFIDYLVGDAATKAICVYVEGFKDGARFLRSAAACRAAGKPLVIVKTGRTPAGERAAQSHTASLAGSYAVLQAACRRHGAILTDDPDAMVRLADLLVRWPTLGGDGIGVVSPSGGGAGIGVDRTVEAGMRLAVLSDATKKRLLEVLIPPQADNPIDLGGRRSGDVAGTAGKVMTPMAQDPDVAALLVVLTTVPFYEATTKELASAALASGKPVLFSVTPGSAADGPRRGLRELGCPYFDSLDQALRVLKLMVDYRALKAQDMHAPPRPGDLPPPASLRGLQAGRLTEPEAKRLLAAYGVPVTREAVAASPEAAVEAAGRIGYPVALKVVARDLVHKSDVGAVKLGLADEAALRTAWQAATESVRRHMPGAAIDGCVVQEMVRGEAELIVGVRRDPLYGPVVLVGFGGVLVEVLEDVQLALAPISPAQGEALMRRLRLWPVLAGVRGRKPLDVPAVAHVLSRLSWLAVDLGERLVDLEVNPLMVRTTGGGVVAADARGMLAALKA
ncbi:MAG: acetate--CoA ligase family protein [Alphaproteobacteria bacterium]|nr:acetate--CoA ligase family protein [Alphaproteobacteria bacterium]